ncbi:maternal embryonic leucine zipper kinase-like [Trichomycterus rosablanca]|uniref:maternal embryonic leucine zipper kinase-like n=1 Tax=Trichomycterus rosablanca TaxID=2290929 RepID=UPI002F351DA8
MHLEVSQTRRNESRLEETRHPANATPTRDFMVLAEDLQHCSVQSCEDAGRRFCFQVVTPTRSCTFQADCEAGRRAWISAIQNLTEREETVESEEDSDGYDDDSKSDSSETLSEGEFQLEDSDSSEQTDCQGPRVSSEAPGGISSGEVVCDALENKDAEGETNNRERQEEKTTNTNPDSFESGHTVGELLGKGGCGSVYEGDRKADVNQQVEVPCTVPETDDTTEGTSRVVEDVSDLHKCYEVYNTIGSGGYATVKLGRHIQTQEPVAIKILEKKELGDELSDLRIEIEALKNLNHQHVCRLYQVMETVDQIYMVLEFCPGGDLFDHIDNNDRLSEEETRRIFRQIVSALAYVHSQGYAHRDLKPENIMLDEKNNIKLIDFGLCAKPEGGLGTALIEGCGTPPYLAPEIIDAQPYLGAEADVWSLGVVLYVMLCGYLPFDGDNFVELHEQITKGHYDTPDWLSPGSVLLIKEMLQVVPERRIKVEHLLDHEWVMKGYSSPVEWHSTCPLDHLDKESITETAVMFRQSNQSTKQLVSKWKFDQTTATYLLLLRRKQRSSPVCS